MTDALARVYRHLPLLRHVPGLPSLFDTLLMGKTALLHRERLLAMHHVERAVLSWPGVTTRMHRFGGTEFTLNNGQSRREIGHLHGNGLLDIPFTGTRPYRRARRNRTTSSRSPPGSAFTSAPRQTFRTRLNCCAATTNGGRRWTAKTTRFGDYGMAEHGNKPDPVEQETITPIWPPPPEGAQPESETKPTGTLTGSVKKDETCGWWGVWILVLSWPLFYGAAQIGLMNLGVFLPGLQRGWQGNIMHTFWFCLAAFFLSFLVRLQFVALANGMLRGVLWQVGGLTMTWAARWLLRVWLHFFP